MFQKPHVKTSGNFLYMLPVAVALSYDGSAMRCIPLILWMTSYFCIMGQMQMHAWKLDCARAHKIDLLAVFYRLVPDQ